MSAKYEGRIGCLIYGGAALVPVGLIVTFILYFGGTMRWEASNYRDFTVLAYRGIGPLMILIGLVSIAIGLAAGFKAEKGSRVGTGRVRVDPFVKVVARFGLDDFGHYIHEGWQFDAYDHPKYLVKLEHSDGTIGEYYTRPEVWDACGEGMVGEAACDGGWLGAFVPRIGP